MRFYSKKNLKKTFMALFALCFCLSCFFLTQARAIAKADGDNSSVFLPATPLESVELISPTHTYADDEITAITTSDNKLLISYSNHTPIEISFSSELGQVLRFKNYLLYRVEHNMYAINLDNTDERLPLTYSVSVTEQQNLACDNSSCYDNGEYLSVAVCVEEKLKIYTITEDANNKPVVSLLSYFSGNIIPIKKAPVAINSTSVFYVAQNGVLCRRDIDALQNFYPYTEISATAMIADEDYVYCVVNNQIYRYTIADENAEPVILSLPDCDYQLGTVSAIADIAFKNGNILITDANGSVQEFKISGDTLKFTGYAIASGFTAYNRIAANASNIERYGNYVAALCSDKLTIIDTENCAEYNENGFINKFLANAPDRFALGNGTVLCASGANVYIADVALDTEDNKKQITGLPTETAPNDITYQSGIYYLIYSGIGANTNIYKIDENTGEQIGDVILFNGVDADAIAVDVFGNVYLADSLKVYRNENDNAYSLTGVTKLATDLAGNLFALANGKIYKLDQAENAFIQAFETTLGAIKSFGLNFDKNQAFFLIEGKEQIYTTTALEFASLQDVLIDAEFNAATQSVRELKVYTVKSGANVYSVSATATAFTFNGLDGIAAEYPFISKFVLSDNLTLYALASENGVVLINEKDLNEKTVEFTDYLVPEKAYITTAVNAYAIPVIEESGTFAIGTASGKIRLNKGAEISVTCEFDILGKTYYIAAADIDGETLNCYIPKSFTTKTLAENIEFSEYRVETVKRTTLYQDAELTDALCELNNGDSVKVLSEDNGVLKVETTKNGETFTGYIPASAIKSKPDTIVRNVLIVLAVFGSLAGTLTYFLLRKRK